MRSSDELRRVSGGIGSRSWHGVGVGVAYWCCPATYNQKKWLTKYRRTKRSHAPVGSCIVSTESPCCGCDAETGTEVSRSQESTFGSRSVLARFFRIHEGGDSDFEDGGILNLPGFPKGGTFKFENHYFTGESQTHAIRCSNSIYTEKKIFEHEIKYQLDPWEDTHLHLPKRCLVDAFLPRNLRSCFYFWMVKTPRSKNNPRTNERRREEKYKIRSGTKFESTSFK